MFSEDLMANRPKARVVRLIGLVLTSPLVATVLVGLALALIELVVVAPMSGRAVFNSGILNSFYLYLIIGFAMVVFGLPFMIIALIVGHFTTPRRPIDGAVLGAVGVGACVLTFSLATDWRVLPYLPLAGVGAFMGWGLVKLGYSQTQPET